MDKTINNRNSFFIRKYKVLLGFLLAISLSSFMVILYQSWQYSKVPGSIEEIPLIRADMAPVRIVPVNPGGEQFSNQDKLIYSTLEDGNFQKKPEINEEVKEIKDIYNDVGDIRGPSQALSKKKPEAPAKINNAEKAITKDKKMISTPFDAMDNEKQ